MRKHLTTIILILLLLTGLSFLLYPTVSDWWNSLHQSRAIAGYTEAVEGMDEESYEKWWNEAREYNEGLKHKPDRYRMTEQEQAEYEALLDISGNGVMGYIEIPGIHCSLPIYHGTEESVLQVAVGHIESSSLPVGGASTHCVLSGHRGLPSAKLFTDLDRLSEGDIFQIRVLNETLTYEIDQIHIVLPHEVDDLGITRGQDHCTLVTCTPYGINSHRLLVRGRRIANPEQAVSVRVTSDAVRIDPVLVAPVAAAPMLLALAVWLIINPGGKKTKKKRKT